MITSFRALVLAALLLCLGGLTQAEQYVDNENWVIHYNAINTSDLSPDVARAYGIPRSGNRAMLSITVMRKTADGLNQPVEADVTASATNLTGQRRDIEMRKIAEQEARYYIGTLRVANQETLEFKVQAKPPGAEEAMEVAFRQQFYVD